MNFCFLLERHLLPLKAGPRCVKRLLVHLPGGVYLFRTVGGKALGQEFVWCPVFFFRRNGDIRFAFFVDFSDRYGTPPNGDLVNTTQGSSFEKTDRFFSLCCKLLYWKNNLKTQLHSPWVYMYPTMPWVKKKDSRCFRCFSFPLSGVLKIAFSVRIPNGEESRKVTRVRENNQDNLGLRSHSEYHILDCLRYDIQFFIVKNLAYGLVWVDDWLSFYQ